MPKDTNTSRFSSVFAMIVASEAGTPLAVIRNAFLIPHNCDFIQRLWSSVSLLDSPGTAHLEPDCSLHSGEMVSSTLSQWLVSETIAKFAKSPSQRDTAVAIGNIIFDSVAPLEFKFMLMA